MPTIFGDKYQIFITCDEEGNISSAEFGQMIVRMDEADFFFIKHEEEAHEIMENIEKYKIQVNGYKPAIVLKEVPVEEETPEEPPTEPTGTEA
jgi:hypothetical protein